MRRSTRPTLLETSKKIHYELEHLYPEVDRQKFWDLFVDHDAWSRSEVLPGTITIVKPGDGHPQGAGAIRSVGAGRMSITEDVVGFRPPEYFEYATRNRSLPVDNFGGELHLEDGNDGLLVRYRGSFNPKYPGTGRLLRYIFRSRQRSVLRGLAEAYDTYDGARHAT